MKWFDRISFKTKTEETEFINDVEIKTTPPNNILDEIIVEHGQIEEVDNIYQARWVWYHTILAVEIAFTNILLIALLVVQIAK